MLEQPLLAFVNRTPLCSKCGLRPRRVGHGTVCNACARGKHKPKPCVFCGVQFVGHPDKLYCCDAHLLEYNAAWRKIAPPASGRFAPKKPLNHCKDCQKEIKRGVLCTSCRSEYSRHALHVRQSAPRKCSLCGALWEQKKSVLGAKVGKGKIGRQGKYCSDCREISDRILKFGVDWEPLSRIKVFLRDGFTCQHCKRKMSTNSVGELSLDHILPVSLGGAHSYANAQCLCVSCNTWKRDRIELEPRLVGVTDFASFKVAKNKGKRTREHESKVCGCGCRCKFTTWMNGANNEFKAGHWSRLRKPSGLKGIPWARAGDYILHGIPLETGDALLTAQSAMRERHARPVKAKRLRNVPTVVRTGQNSTWLCYLPGPDDKRLAVRQLDMLIRKRSPSVHAHHTLSTVIHLANESHPL